jgi:hypothetical protein
VKLRVEVLTNVMGVAQCVEFELNDIAVDVLTSVNAQISGSVRVTFVHERILYDKQIPTGFLPRIQNGDA